MFCLLCPSSIPRPPLQSAKSWDRSGPGTLPAKMWRARRACAGLFTWEGVSFQLKIRVCSWVLLQVHVAVTQRQAPSFCIWAPTGVGGGGILPHSPEWGLCSHTALQGVGHFARGCIWHTPSLLSCSKSMLYHLCLLWEVCPQWPWILTFISPLWGTSLP